MCYDAGVAHHYISRNGFGKLHAAQQSRWDEDNDPCLTDASVARCVEAVQLTLN